MAYNMGYGERWVRIVLAIVLLFVGVAVGGAWAVVLFILTTIVMATAILGYCPLYGLIHVSTFHPRRQ